MPDDTLPSSSSSPYKKSTSLRVQGKKLTAAQQKEAKEKFLKSFASNGNVRAACIAAGVDRSAIRYWEEHDEQFSAQYNLAKSDVDDAIRAEIFRRAMYGEEEPMVSMGRPVYEEIPMLDSKGKPILDGKNKPVTRRGKMLTIKRKSDVLLMFHAKSRMPEYRDKQHIDMDANVNAQVQSPDTITIDTRSLSADQLAKLKAFALEMKESELNG